MIPNKGKIIIAGAGPGDIELITLKLQSALHNADVILYDHLVNKSLLFTCKKEALKIPVGKSGDPDSKEKFAQEDIHKLMISHGKEGKTVLRLKGGDPFIFGRGSEECEEIVKEGIAFEIIPGITSAIAGPAYAGIPLTHRGISRSVAFATGHLMKGEDPNNIVIPEADTIVFLMAVKNLPLIVNKFFERNYAKETKCALIENACCAMQRTFISTLADICQASTNNDVKPPALFVVGDVTDLRNSLSWFEKKTLFGRHFLITRTQDQSLTMASKLRELGAAATEYPVIEIKRIDNAKGILSQEGYLEEFTDIIFTSVKGVEIFFDILLSLGLDSRDLSGKKIISIGKMTAERLAQYGIKADIVPDIYQAEGILEKLEKNLTGRKFLLPRAKGARKLLLDKIEKRNGTAEELLLYEAVQPDNISKIDKTVKLDGICFTSTSTVVNFCKFN